MSWWPLLIGVLLAGGVFLLPQLTLSEDYVYYHRQLWMRNNSAAGLSRRSLQENSWAQSKSHWNGLAPSMANLKFWACVYLDTSLFWYFIYNPSSAVSHYAPYFYFNAILSIISGVVLLFLLTNYILAIFPRGFSAWCFYIALTAWRICCGLFIFSYLVIAWGIYRSGQMTLKNVLNILLGILPEAIITLYSEGTGWLAFVLMMTSFAWAMIIIAASLSIKRMLNEE